MEPYLRFLCTYVSVSGPHLGYLYSSNSLFNSGLWLLKKLKGTQCIHQLTFTDDPDLQNTFLYRLCKVMILIDNMLWRFLCLWTLFSLSHFQWKFSSLFSFSDGLEKPLFVVTKYISSMFISPLSKRPWRTSGTLFSYLHHRYYLILKHLLCVASSASCLQKLHLLYYL